MMNTGELETDVGTTLSGEKALNEGLIDLIGTIGEVLENLYKIIEES